MNKILTFVTALALIFTVNTAFAGSNNNKAVALLTHQVDRNTIQELKLNEMAYIQLKDLTKNYRAEAEVTKVLFASDAQTLATRLQELENRYTIELGKVLTPSQIEGFTQRMIVASK